MAKEATLNDVIQRQIAEGLLTRNSGTNSLKSLKESIGNELSVNMSKLSDMSSNMLDIAIDNLMVNNSILEVLTAMQEFAGKEDLEDDRADARSRRRLAEESFEGDDDTVSPETKPEKIKKKGLLDGIKLPGMGIMGWALLLAGAAAAFVGLDKIILWFKETLVPGMKKFWDNGLKPFWENALKPLVEWFTGSALPVLGDAFMRSLDTIGEFFEGLGNVGKLLAEGDYLGAVNELINTIGDFVIDSVDNLLTTALELFGVDMKGKTVFETLGAWVDDISKSVGDWWKDNIYDGDQNKIFGFKIPTTSGASDWISDLSKKTTKWFEDNIYDGNTKIFGTELMGGQGDDELDGGGESFITAIGRKLNDWIKANIYDGDANTIFGYAIPENLFEFNMFNSIKQKVDDVILAIKEIFTGPFTMANLLSKTTLVGKTFLDLVWVPLDLIIGAVRDIFKFGDPKTPFRMTEFIFGDKEGKGGVLPSIIGFFTNEEGTGIFDFSAPGEEFSIMGIVRKLMTKISDFFTSLFDIDFGAIAKDLLPEALKKVLPDSVFQTNKEKNDIERQEIKAQMAIEKAEYDKRQGIISGRLEGREFSDLSEKEKKRLQGQRGLKDEAQSRIEELEARLAELEPKAANDNLSNIGKTAKSLGDAAEVKAGSTKQQQNPPPVALIPTAAAILPGASSPTAPGPTNVSQTGISKTTVYKGSLKDMNAAESFASRYLAGT